jgi:hypothetical protein
VFKQLTLLAPALGALLFVESSPGPIRAATGQVSRLSQREISAKFAPATNTFDYVKRELG